MLFRSRFETSERKRDDLLERFLTATSSGDMEGLLALLATDVVLHTDGGGKAVAAPNLIHGARNVARGAVGTLNKLLPKNLEYRVTDINGEAGVVSYLNGKPYSVLTVEVREGRIQAIYIVSNPDKLGHVPALAAAD